MKTLGQLSPKAAPLAVAVSLAFFTGNLRAFGPGGAGNVGGANGVGAVGGSGARGGVLSGGNVAGTAAVSGPRGGVSISNSGTRPAAGFSPRGVVVHGGAPAGLSQPYRNVLNGPSPVVGARPTAPQSVSTRPGNNWSGTAVGPSDVRATRSPYHSNGGTSNRFTGQRLAPGANGANLPTAINGTDRNHNGNGDRNRRPTFRVSGRYYYNPYFYGPTYAPYIGYYGGGYPAYAGAYPYDNDVPSIDTDNGPAAPVVTPQYPAQGQDSADDNTRQPEPAASQNQNGRAAVPGTIPGNGPDSLVEAVQEELVRRGYFGGKVDAMFGTDTKDALRKFQSDHHLAATGLINEATLHALQLD